MTWDKILDWLLNNAPALIISIAALVISIKSWHKTRVFYDLETYIIAGSAGNARSQLDDVRKKLNTGKYTIINTFEETYQSHGDARNRVNIIVGKIKK